MTQILGYSSSCASTYLQDKQQNPSTEELLNTTMLRKEGVGSKIKYLQKQGVAKYNSDNKIVLWHN